MAVTVSLEREVVGREKNAECSYLMEMLNMSHKKDVVQSVKRGSKRQTTNGYHSPKNNNPKQRSSPYSSRGTSPLRPLRKSQSAEERFCFNENPPGSRGSE